MFINRRTSLAILPILISALFLVGPAAAGASTRAAETVAGLRLVSYFPAHAGWDRMWSRWDPEELSADLRRIAELDGNCVRIVVNAPSFGFPQVDPVMRARLLRTFQLASDAGLRVQLTLFDGWYRYGAIDQSKQWASEILGGLEGDPEIAYIDLHNELPADTNPRALAWAQAMVPYVQSISGGIPVTVSTSISSGLAPLTALTAGLASTPPDLFDVHYYGNASTAYGMLSAARRAVGQAPLFIGETGFATDPSYGWAAGLPPEPASLAAYQDYYYRMVNRAAEALSIAPPSPWILYDMPGQGDTGWGEHMGLLTPAGAAKPAAGVVSDAFAGEAVATAFNNGFEQAGAASMPFIWRVWLPGAAAFSSTTAVAHSGGRSVVIERAAGNHKRACPAFYAAPIAAIEGDRTYQASAWVRGRGERGLSRVVLVWIDSAGRYLGSTPSPALASGDTPWTKLTATGTPPPRASGVEIDLQVCEDPGRTWFDDVSFAPR